MKKALLIFLIASVVSAVQAPALGNSMPPSFNVLLAGGEEANMIRIWLTPDGHNYVIDSIAPLEVGGSVCSNAEGKPNELVCQAPMISSFTVNAAGGDDVIVADKKIAIPVILLGGPG